MTAGVRSIIAVAVVATGCALLGGGCRDVPAPEDGVQAVSPISLPSPGVVVSDTMRDSTGAVAPLGLTAYALDGEPLSPQPTPTFVVLDTGAHMAGALLIGDNAGKSVRVVGAMGSLQSQIATVKITERPDTLVAADSTLHNKAYSIITGDTVVNSPDLSVLVQGGSTTTGGIEAVVVHYSIDRAPTGNGQGPSVVLVSGSKLSSRDTSDASGRAARTARLRLAALTTSEVDTVLVTATASYRGQTLGIVQFSIIYTRQ